MWWFHKYATTTLTHTVYGKELVSFFFFLSLTLTLCLNGNWWLWPSAERPLDAVICPVHQSNTRLYHTVPFDWYCTIISINEMIFKYKILHSRPLCSFWYVHVVYHRRHTSIPHRVLYRDLFASPVQARPAAVCVWSCSFWGGGSP